MKSIVISISDFNNPNLRAVFEYLGSLCSSYAIVEERNCVYFYYSSDSFLTMCSSFLFVSKVLHRVVLP